MIDDTLQRKCTRTSSLCVSIKAIPTASAGHEGRFSLFVPIVSGETVGRARRARRRHGTRTSPILAKLKHTRAKEKKKE